MKGRPWVAVNVLPEFRGRGVGGAVFAALSAHARKQDASGLACEVLRDDAYSLSFLERHGFSARRSWVRLELDLGEADGPDPVPPEGVELTSLADEPGLLPQMHEVAVATYPELGGHYARHADSFLRWQVYELGNPALPLDLTRIASAGGRAVGFATMHLLLDGALGELRMVVVLEEWRQRGVARALVGSQIDGARRRGVERVMTWVPEDGPVTFYRHLGLQPRGGSLELVGPLF